MILSLLLTASLICHADFNSDGVVNGLDTPTFVAAFGQGCLPTATADLSWTNPIQNADCTPMTDLAAVRVYWHPGNVAGIELAVTAAYTAVGLYHGQEYVFWVTAVDQSGNESGPSMLLAKVIP